MDNGLTGMKRVRPGLGRYMTLVLSSPTMLACCRSWAVWRDRFRMRGASAISKLRYGSS